ncbi:MULTISPECIES: hypothetical protein [unclassified Legionella]|uniref:hypothetical protein n=1 Tax=unclassified Legionella TaxID=2622702 RepID=UPI0010559914|nr:MULTISPECIES: hypothetical protein [unclassified Legionella]MDI9818752.1 hypothetical protein [Legionella sp. PL877]
MPRNNNNAQKGRDNTESKHDKSGEKAKNHTYHAYLFTFQKGAFSKLVKELKQQEKEQNLQKSKTGLTC